METFYKYNTVDIAIIASFVTAGVMGIMVLILLYFYKTVEKEDEENFSQFNDFFSVKTSLKVCKLFDQNSNTWSISPKNNKSVNPRIVQPGIL